MELIQCLLKHLLPYDAPQFFGIVMSYPNWDLSWIELSANEWQNRVRRLVCHWKLWQILMSQSYLEEMWSILHISTVLEDIFDTGGQCVQSITRVTDQHFQERHISGVVEFCAYCNRNVTKACAKIRCIPIITINKVMFIIFIIYKRTRLRKILVCGHNDKYTNFRSRTNVNELVSFSQIRLYWRHSLRVNIVNKRSFVYNRWLFSNYNDNL